MYVVSNMLAKAWIHACGLRTAATTMCCGTNWFTIGDARRAYEGAEGAERRYCLEERAEAKGGGEPARGTVAESVSG